MTMTTYNPGVTTLSPNAPAWPANTEESAPDDVQSFVRFPAIKVDAAGRLIFDDYSGMPPLDLRQGIVVEAKRFGKSRIAWGPDGEGDLFPRCSSEDGVRGQGEYTLNGMAHPEGDCKRCPLSEFTKDEDGNRVRPVCTEVRSLFVEFEPGDGDIHRAEIQFKSTGMPTFKDDVVPHARAAGKGNTWFALGVQKMGGGAQVWHNITAKPAPPPVKVEIVDASEEEDDLPW